MSWSAVNAWVWVFPVLVFFIAARPYFAPVGRVVTAAAVWAFFYGVIGTIIVAGGIGDVPVRFVIGFVQMGIGIGLLEWLFGRLERARIAAKSV